MLKKILKFVAKVWAVTAIPKWSFLGFMAAKKSGYLAPVLALVGL